MVKPKPEEIDPDLSAIKQADFSTLPVEAVDTNEDEPEADANGDSDDEREDENEAVRSAP
jgi:hypothetical protein